MKKKPFEIKAYGISHATKTIVGFRTYQMACLAIDMGMLDWAGDREAYHKLDKEDIKDYAIVYSLK